MLYPIELRVQVACFPGLFDAARNEVEGHLTPVLTLPASQGIAMSTLAEKRHAGKPAKPTEPTADAGPVSNLVSASSERLALAALFLNWRLTHGCFFTFAGGAAR